MGGCPLTAALAAIGGKWKLTIVYWLTDRPKLLLVGFAQKLAVRADSPPREEGWPRHKKKGPVPKTARTGWSLRHPLSKRILEMELVSDHPVCGASVATRLFIDAAATPPLEEGNDTQYLRLFVQSSEDVRLWGRAQLSRV